MLLFKMLIKNLVLFDKYKNLLGIFNNSNYRNEYNSAIVRDETIQNNKDNFHSCKKNFILNYIIVNNYSDSIIHPQLINLNQNSIFF